MSSTSTTLRQKAFADAVRARNLDAIVATFADNIRLDSPVSPDPFVGRGRVSRLFGVLSSVFADIQITDQFASPQRYALAFRTHVGSQPIQIVDLLTFDDTGHIATFTVTARPIAGIQALAVAVAPHLAEIG